MTLVDDYDFLLEIEEPRVNTAGQREMEESSIEEMTEILEK